MNKLTTLVFLFISTILFGQTYEEKIAEKSCECISEDSETVNLNDLLKKCIISSKIEVESNDSNDKDNSQFTVEGIRKIFSDVSNLVIEKCPALRTKVSEQKKQEFYRLSENQKANAYFEKGNQLRDKKQFELAIDQYEKAIKKDMEFVMAYDHLGVSYRMNNDLDNAIKTYKKSLEIFPEGDFALLNIAAAYSIKKNELEAQKHYENLIKFYPENPEGYYGSGKTNLILGNNEIALRNTLIAMILYDNQNLKKISDAETLLSFVHTKMKEENDLEKFNRILKEYNVEFKE
ncbi:tetratricopeptide repeat protein [Formosa undariae]|uniref:Tetratricopeptide repeat protein n=1 Tax=Formosa undariae TaxID=1325436 RepID=A0ABV5F2B5_9FLAO